MYGCQHCAMISETLRRWQQVYHPPASQQSTKNCHHGMQDRKLRHSSEKTKGSWLGKPQCSLELDIIQCRWYRLLHTGKFVVTGFTDRQMQKGMHGCAIAVNSMTCWLPTEHWSCWWKLALPLWAQNKKTVWNGNTLHLQWRRKRKPEPYPQLEKL